MLHCFLLFHPMPTGDALSIFINCLVVFHEYQGKIAIISLFFYLTAIVWVKVSIIINSSLTLDFINLFMSGWIFSFLRQFNNNSFIVDFSKACLMCFHQIMASTHLVFPSEQKGFHAYFHYRTLFQWMHLVTYFHLTYCLFLMAMLDVFMLRNSLLHMIFCVPF